MRLISFFLLLSSTLLFSCGNTQEEEQIGFQTSSIQRLARYYPLDSLAANGDTLYHTLPDVVLSSQNDSDFSPVSVKGKIGVSDFFFASCEGICPVMNRQMSRVQKAFALNKDVVLLSYTVDPERDSVMALQGYSRKYSSDSTQWYFITGEKKKLYDLARYGYFLPVEPGNGDSEDFIHSDQIILTDRNAVIRGYYNGTDSSAVDSLIADIKILLNEKQ